MSKEKVRTIENGEDWMDIMQGKAEPATVRTTEESGEQWMDTLAQNGEDKSPELVEEVEVSLTTEPTLTPGGLRELNVWTEQQDPAILRVARQAHEINRAYCIAIGEDAPAPWEQAPLWQRQSIVAGVLYHRDNPGAQPEDSHNSWLEEKKKDGWSYGEVKDPVAKTHPCFLPYEELPVEQQVKDHLFISVVRSNGL